MLPGAVGLSDDDLVARFPGRSLAAIRQKLRRPGKPPGQPTEIPDVTAAPEFREDERSGDEWKITGRTGQPIRSVEDLAAFYSVDLAVWEVVSFRCGVHDMGYKNAENDAESIPLYNISAKFKKRRGAFEARVEVDAILAELRASAPRIKPKTPDQREHADRLLELSVADLHLGKLAWHEECGEDYDTDIAESLWWSAIPDLIRKTAAFRPRRVALIVGNDLLNADSRRNATFAGTPQQVDGRHTLTFRRARTMIQRTVEEILAPQFEEVTVVMVPGNHDWESVWYLGEVLDAYFDRAPSVTIDNAPTARKYLRHGAVLLGFAHGHNEKHADLPMVMATEQREAWGQIRFPEFHVGHLHKRNALRWVGTNEQHGCVVRVLPSLCGADDWHVEKGFVGNVRCAEGYVWDAVDGPVGSAVFTAPIRPDLNRRPIPEVRAA